MKITKCLLAAPIAMLLSVGMADGKDDAEAKKTKGSSAQSAEKDNKDNKKWKRSTEGHRPQDLNGDGIIQRHEWPGNDVSFHEVDTDGDGVLTNKDRSQGAQGGGARMYDRPVNDNKAKERK